MNNHTDQQNLLVFLRNELPNEPIYSFTFEKGEAERFVPFDTKRNNNNCIGMISIPFYEAGMYFDVSDDNTKTYHLFGSKGERFSYYDYSSFERIIHFYLCNCQTNIQKLY